MNGMSSRDLGARLEKFYVSCRPQTGFILNTDHEKPLSADSLIAVNTQLEALKLCFPQSE